MGAASIEKFFAGAIDLMSFKITFHNGSQFALLMIQQQGIRTRHDS